eukprot:TRINITY_DN2150_c0_g1_i2.p1 TRINITY_DN2150_c0_g1~~TRINITY_DN2150_c0_g1_i2.p1  ORF type:complete len:110 (+),score=34.15 TRINITY_DN2150_c0_g1_i2:12-341(+)
MSLTPSDAKALRINTGVVKRLTKDLNAYRAELGVNESKSATLRSTNADTHDINKQDEVVAETRMMIADTVKRLAVATEELQSNLEGKTEIQEQIVTDAIAVLSDAKAAL